MNEMKLTQFSAGGGCSCKIAPHILSDLVLHTRNAMHFPNLIIGNSTNDDAAIWDIGNGKYSIHTTDFFTPMIEDAYTYGSIAAANALSDIYAMGGTPELALCIFLTSPI